MYGVPSNMDNLIIIHCTRGHPVYYNESADDDRYPGVPKGVISHSHNISYIIIVLL